MNSLIWLIAIFVVQAIIAGLAKKAQQKQEAERQARARQGQPGQPAPATRPSAPVVSDDPIEVARREIDAQITAPRTETPRGLDAARSPIDAQVVAPHQARVVRAPASNTVNPAVPTRPAVTVARPPQGTAKPRVLARGTAEPQQAPSRPKVIARSATKPVATPPRVAVQRATTVREEADAMASRARVAASIEAVRAAERRVDSPIVTKAPAAAQLGRPAVSLTPASITAAMRNPARIREAFVIAEVLQGPRSMRAF